MNETDEDVGHGQMKLLDSFEEHAFELFPLAEYSTLEDAYAIINGNPTTRKVTRWEIERR